MSSGDAVPVKVPDIGDFDAVDVIEVLVAVGDTVAIDDSLVTLESDKASMEVPSPVAGTVQSIEVAVGDSVAAGSVLISVVVAEAPEAEPEGERVRATPSDRPQSAASVGEAQVGQGVDSADAEHAQPDESGEGTTESEKTGLDSAPKAPKTPKTPNAPSPRPLTGQDYDVDLVVIGSGPGGYAAAFRAADLGLRTALVERYQTLGGVCLNVGCIPSKALLHAAKVIDEAAAFADHGIRFPEPTIDLEALRGWKESVVGRLTGGLVQLAKRRKVEVIQGTATFASPHELEIDGRDQRLSFAQAIVAVGSRSVQLKEIADSPRVFDSTGALELGSVPARLLVIGGGIIGLEMATVYAALGSRVSVVELLPTLMTGADRDLVKPLQQRLAKRYQAIWTSTKVTRVEIDGDQLVATLEGDQAPASARFDAVLVAVGRRPNGDQINAEAAGLVVGRGGFLAVDDQQRTNVPHIFAIGDVAGNPMLAHKATHEGHVAAEVAAGLPSGFDARVIPSVAYTDPEVAWVGLTETEAKEKGIAYGKGVFPWAASGRSLALGRDEGMTKLLFDPETHRILGGGAVGPQAGDLMAEIGLAIEMNSDAADIALTVHAHPTLSESVGLAAEVFEGTVTDLYAPKRTKK